MNSIMSYNKIKLSSTLTYLTQQAMNVIMAKECEMWKMTAATSRHRPSF